MSHKDSIPFPLQHRGLLHAPPASSPWPPRSRYIPAYPILMRVSAFCFKIHEEGTMYTSSCLNNVFIASTIVAEIQFSALFQFRWSPCWMMKYFYSLLTAFLSFSSTSGNTSSEEEQLWNKNTRHIEWMTLITSWWYWILIRVIRQKQFLYSSQDFSYPLM